ncbi:AidA/PixA family protein [Xenorhabdus sp. PB30.3]|uniref:AidA/PixA family protein n=1 Tax=Xenorhabdus sp. PB30.3 TaxID=2788941 RepID=UPI001E370A20|nr:AidA/PixA family protein [Xenorhabdus sp. PB30.3]MCC8381602.1 hypothetical protein [Xenorhabdus sp. PB30.3]
MNNNFMLYLALDLDNIVSKLRYSKDVDTPGEISTDMLHTLILDDKQMLVDNGGVRLTLDNVLRGDSIYWSVIRLPSYKSYYSAVLTKYKAIGNNTQIMSKPELNVKSVKLPYIKNDDEQEIEVVKIKNNYWRSEVMSVGDVKSQDYQGHFSIYDANGLLVGYSTFKHKLILNPLSKN